MEVRSTKSYHDTLLLAIILGIFGAHRFYVGRKGTGLLWLLTGGLFLIGWIYDLIMISTNRFRDGEGNVLYKL